MGSTHLHVLLTCPHQHSASLLCRQGAHSLTRSASSHQHPDHLPLSDQVEEMILLSLGVQLIVSFLHPASALSVKGRLNFYNFLVMYALMNSLPKYPTHWTIQLCSWFPQWSSSHCLTSDNSLSLHENTCDFWDQWTTWCVFLLNNTYLGKVISCEVV